MKLKEASIIIRANLRKYHLHLLNESIITSINETEGSLIRAKVKECQ